MEKFDVLVIGGGPGGYVCAIRAAQLGFKTACVEDRPALGGTCLNVGCIPSKALLESSHHYHSVQHSFESHGIKVGKVSLDLPTLLARKDQVVTGITGGVAYLFNKNKVTWLKGKARLTGPGKVAVDAKGETIEYEASHIVIATGSAPINLKSAPFDHKNIVDSEDALNFPAVPKHLIVVGGGVIGLELGSVWLRLGARVTVIEALGNILGPMDGAISAAALKLFTKQGMEFNLNSFLNQAQVTGAGKVKVSYTVDGKTPKEVECDKVLVAIGRRAYTDGLGLESVGLATDKAGRIEVDHGFRTKVPGIYAIGDVIAGPMLAHKAEEEGVALAELIAGQPGHVNYEAIPNVVYTWPEVASVGITSEECAAKGIAVKEGKFFFKANGRAKAMGEADGFVKMIADAKTDRLKGIHIIGPMASELIAEAALAFEYGASAEDIARSVHAHPTLAEAMKEAALDVAQRAIHS